jgi:ABC-type branched-subunit amino acid transport system ATPase component/branched-subunit amino acid ABC-type transport system permease component
MRDLLPFIVAGIASGSIYSLAGVGLVVTYRTSGIFNFAHGALASVGAFGFYILWSEHGIPLGLSVILAVPVFGIALGLVFARLAETLGRASLALKVAGTVGVLLIVQGITSVLYSTSTVSFPNFLPTSTIRLGGVNIGINQIVVSGISIGATVGLYLLMQRTWLGRGMRGLVDNSDLLSLSGIDPRRVRRWAWIIGCTFATLSGLLLCPNYPLNSNSLTLLIVQAFGAAAVGGFTNVWRTWLGGMIIGIGASIATKYVGNVSYLQGLPGSLPFVVLFIVLVARRRLGETMTYIAQRPRATWRAPMRFQLAAAGVVLTVLCFVPSFAGARLTGWTNALAFVVLFLALGFLVRQSGQVSLGHIAFAAIGAVAFSRLVTEAGLPWLPALLLSGLVAVPIGAVLAIPAIRSSGLYLAIATLGFGLAMQILAYPTSWMFGANSVGRVMPTPRLSWLGIGSAKSFYYVVLACAALLSVVVVWLTRTRLGRLLAAISDAPGALASLGAGVNVLRVQAFCISAYVAGVAGALAGMVVTQVTGASYDPITSLELVTLIVVVSGGAPWYALVAGLGYGVPPTYLTGNINFYLEMAFGGFAVLVAMAPPVGVPVRIRQLVDRIGGRQPVVPGGATDGETTARATRTGDLAPLGAAADRPPAPVGLSRGRSDLDSATEPAGGLEVVGLRVRYGGVVAVADLSLSAPRGQITGLIGPNGAGKTTTFNACSGTIRPAAGRVLLNGEDVTQMSVAKRARRGLGRSFQRMNLFDSLSVAENVALGREAGIAGSNVVSQLISREAERKEVRRSAAEAIEMCGLEDSRGSAVGALPTGQRRLVELARCLAGDFDILLLDEPSSGLDAAETQRFAEILSLVVAERGTGILLVEHDLGLVMSICSVIYVLDFGNLILEGAPSEVLASPQVQAAYLGSDELAAGLVLDKLASGSGS